MMHLQSKAPGAFCTVSSPSDKTQNLRMPSMRNTSHMGTPS